MHTKFKQNYTPNNNNKKKKMLLKLLSKVNNSKTVVSREMILVHCTPQYVNKYAYHVSTQSYLYDKVMLRTNKNAIEIKHHREIYGRYLQQLFTRNPLVDIAV